MSTNEYDTGGYLEPKGPQVPRLVGKKPDYVFTTEQLKKLSTNPDGQNQD